MLTPAPKKKPISLSWDYPGPHARPPFASHCRPDGRYVHRRHLGRVPLQYVAGHAYKGDRLTAFFGQFYGLYLNGLDWLNEGRLPQIGAVAHSRLWRLVFADTE